MRGVRARIDGHHGRDSLRAPWCWPAAASRPTPPGGRAISGPAGTSPRCAGPASTKATASAWRWRPAPCRPATGLAATRSPGTGMHRISATSPWATASRSHSYPFSIIVNASGERFVDEGADFRNYTYAAYGRRVLEQPGQMAWQVFDSQVTHLLRDEYRIRQVTRAKADTLEGLVAQMEGIDGARFLETVRAYKRRGDDGGSLRPDREGRPRHPRHRPAQVQLGQPDRDSAVRGLCRDLRHHLHLRRTRDRSLCPGAGGLGRADLLASSRRASWSAVSSTATIRAARAWSRARCSAASPALALPTLRRRGRDQ